MGSTQFLSSRRTSVSEEEAFPVTGNLALSPARRKMGELDTLSRTQSSKMTLVREEQSTDSMQKPLDLSNRTRRIVTRW